MYSTARRGLNPNCCSVKNNERILHLLDACRRSPSSKSIKPLHALTVTLLPSLKQPVFVRNNLIFLYASLGQLAVARTVFDEMRERNAASFSTMITAYSKLGKLDEAWDVFSQMRRFGFSPTQFSVSVLVSCDSLDVYGGIQLQTLSFKNGLFESDVFVGTALLGLYGRFGCLKMAVRVFEDMPSKSLVTWNSIMLLLGRSGFVEDCVSLFRELVRMQESLSESSLLGVLCALSSEEDLEIGEQLHGLVVKRGFDYNVLVTNSLVNMYAKCGYSSLAEHMFDDAPSRDTVSWNTIICAMVRTHNPLKALDFFASMFIHDVVPNQATFVSVVSASTVIQMPNLGRSIHAMVIKNSLQSNVFVGSALINFYSKSDNLEVAHLCLDDIREKNEVSWNSLISGYADKSRSSCWFSLCIQMLRLDFRLNEFTFSAVLKSSGAQVLQQLHSLLIKMGYQENKYVQSSLMASYAKNGLITEAQVLFDASDYDVIPFNIISGMYNRLGQYYETINLLSVLEQPDRVSWNIVISACARSGNFVEVYNLFKHMLRTRISPDNYTFVSLLSVCTKLSDLGLGSSIHAVIIKTEFGQQDTFVCNILLDMYGKCGCLGSSVKIFEETKERNVITWTALISTLGIHGYVHEAFDRFREMELFGLKPDRVTFIAMFVACRHGGLVREGMELFQKMSSGYGIEPDMDHYHSVVDLLVKNGKIGEAEKIISGMPFSPDALIWRSFLDGFKRCVEAKNQKNEILLEA